MPQITIPFPDENSIPAELKAFKKADSNSVVVWVGDNVAAETNPGLAANRDTILKEKTDLQTKYDNEKAQLTATNNQLSTEVLDLRQKVATSAGITAEDVALLEAVKPFGTKPTEIKSKLEAADTAVSENNQLKRQILVQEASQLLGYQPTAFSTMLGHPELAKDVDLVIEEVTENNEKVKKVMANVKNAQGQVEKKDFATYVNETPGWKAVLPALQTSDQQGGGPNWLPQGTPRPTGGTGGADLVKDHIDAQNAQANAKPNPLRPTQPKPAAPATT